ncbi:hypothetical protein EMCRGX_G027266 [Ephydatia muelleri]
MGKSRRLSGGGRKVNYVDEEAQIAELVLAQREKALRVTYKYIAEKAKESIEDPCFKASRWWVTTFIDHWGFSLRQRLPSDLTEKVISFIRQCKTCMKLNHVSSVTWMRRQFAGLSTTTLREPTSAWFTVSKLSRRHSTALRRNRRRPSRPAAPPSPAIRWTRRPTATDATDEDGGPSGTRDAIAPRTATAISGPGLPVHIMRPDIGQARNPKIEKGKYFLFDKLLPPLDDGQAAKKGSTRRQVLTSAPWMEAWNIFAATRIQTARQTALELVKYQNIICQLFTAYSTAAASSLLPVPSRPTTTPAGTTPTSITPAGSSHHPELATHNAGQEICQRFNLGRCNKGAECFFVHKCWDTGSGGDHSAKACPRAAPVAPSHNLPSAHAHPDMVDAELEKEIPAGRLIGPAHSWNRHSTSCAPLALVGFEKKNGSGGRYSTSQHRMVTCRVNDHINKEDFPVQYSSVDDAMALLSQYGQDAFMAKIDLKAAFRLIPAPVVRSTAATCLAAAVACPHYGPNTTTSLSMGEGYMYSASHLSTAVYSLDISMDTPSSGQPPHFIQEPQDTVLHNTPLVLKCAAQGDPSPTITWYRGDPPALVSDGHVVNGSLVIPSVVEGVDASRGGIPYHCRASSVQFGTIRSRTATVYYAFFGGPSEGETITYSVKNASSLLDQDNVALYCNVSGSNPPPSITWVDDLNQTIPTIGTSFLYLDGGRYLAIIGVDPVTAQRVFHCRVTNVFGMLSMDSPTQYRFNITASPGTGLVIYKPLQDVFAFEGDTNVQFSMVVADGGGLVPLTYLITSVPAGSSLKTTTLSTLHAGDGTTLTVQVMSYPPPDHVQWYMNGSLVKPSGLYLISNVSVSDNSTVPITYIASLTISSVNFTTQGFYWASFYGYMGVVNTSSISLPFNYSTCVEGCVGVNGSASQSSIQADAATADGHYWIIAILLVVLVVLMIGISVILIAVCFHHKRKANSTEHSSALDEFVAEGLNDNGYSTVCKKIDGLKLQDNIPEPHAKDTEDNIDISGMYEALYDFTQSTTNKGPEEPSKAQPSSGVRKEDLYSLPDKKKKRHIKVEEKESSGQVLTLQKRLDLTKGYLEYRSVKLIIAL